MIWFLLIVFGVILGITGSGWFMAVAMIVCAFIDVVWARPYYEQQRAERQ